MSRRLSRRRFVAVAGPGALAARPLAALAAGEAPQVLARRAAKPVVVASANGNRFKDDDGLTCAASAFKMIAAGADVLDAVVAGVNILELDPDETGVGYGRLPNADGAVQLDASMMHGPLKRAGAVAFLERVRTPSQVAKAVLEQTDHRSPAISTPRYRNEYCDCVMELIREKAAGEEVTLQSPTGPLPTKARELTAS